MFYETRLGDTWDMIAKRVYGDEMKADFLLENNPFLVAVAVFDAGTYVYIPDLSAVDEASYEDWRR